MLKQSIFCKLPNDVVDKIFTFCNGPLDSDLYQRKKAINNVISQPSNDIILNLIEDYTKIPELEISNGEFWYNYIGCSRLPKLEPPQNI